MNDDSYNSKYIGIYITIIIYIIFLLFVGIMR